MADEKSYVPLSLALDPHLRPVADGVAGEMYVGGAGVARGYTSPRETAARFLPDPFTQETGARIYRTGDLARRLPNGSLEFIDRADRQLKIRGHRIEPSEIEDALLTHPDVADVAVVGVASEGDVTRLAAYVVPASATLDAPMLRSFCFERLPAHLVPSLFVILDRLPRSANGKVDHRCLSEGQVALHDSDTMQRVLDRVEAMSLEEVESVFRELGHAPAV